MIRMRISVLASFFVLGGCMRAEEAPMFEAEMAKSEVSAVAAAPSAEPSPAPPGLMASGSGGRAFDRAAKPKKRGRPKGAESDGEAGDMPADDGVRPGSAPKPKRMVHYNGFLKLRVSNPTETLQQATEIADAAGGYVESLSSTTVTLRVPVAKFREIYTKLAKIGDVLSRSMTAHDVTDAFVAMDLRVKTLRASRDRLITLLARAKKTREKLHLLREIQRLTEEIDQLEMHLGTLVSLAALSRLTVEAVPHQLQVRGSVTEPIAAFRWIHGLSPFARDIAFHGDKLELAVPKGMVELSDRAFWIAESADGAVIWASEQENLPAGSSEYWINAIKTRLGPEFGEANISKIGGFQVLRMVDQSEKAYRYVVAARVAGDVLELIEVYYPSGDHEKRYGAAVKSVIEGGAK
jgi:hypothetical protein